MPNTSIKDMQALSAFLTADGPPNGLILAINVGADEGFAAGGPGHMVSGRWRTRGSESPMFMLLCMLEKLQKAAGLSHVLVEGQKNKRAAGRVAAILEWAEDEGIPHAVVDAGFVKKAFTGKGNASLDAVHAECTRRGFRPSPDEAPAIALLSAGLSAREGLATGDRSALSF